MAHDGNEWNDEVLACRRRRKRRQHHPFACVPRPAGQGYDPVTQLVGYLISGDPTYITSYGQARSMICRLERDEIMEELVRVYLKGLDS